MSAATTLKLPPVVRHEYLYRCIHCRKQAWLTVQVPRDSAVRISCDFCQGAMVFIKRRVDRAAVDRLIVELLRNYR